MRHALLFAGLAVSLLSAAPISGQSPVSYDSLMKQDVDGRSALFSRLSTTNKAEIMAAHTQRWVEKNKSRLSPEQVDLLRERMVLVADELSGKLPKTQPTADRFNDLQRRTAQLFTWEDMRQATTLYADYIPKSPCLSSCP